MIAVYFHTISILPNTTISFDESFSRVAPLFEKLFFLFAKINSFNFHRSL